MDGTGKKLRKPAQAKAGAGKDLTPPDPGDSTPYRALFAAARDAILVADAESGMILDANPQAETLTGRDLTELRAMHHTQLHPPEHAEQARAHFKQVAENTGQIITTEVQDRTGRHIPVEISSSTYRDAAGRQVVCGIFRDISAHLRIEAQLRASEQRVRQVLNSLFVFVAVLDLDGRVLEINQPPLVAAGIDAQDVLGRLFWDCYWWTHDPGVRARLKASFGRARQEQAVRYDVPARMAGGQLMPIDFMLCPMRDHTGQPANVIASGVDITDRLRLLDHIRQNEARLAAAQELARMGSWEWDLRKNEWTRSRELEMLMGLPPGGPPASFEAAMAAVVPEERQRVMDVMQEILRTRKPGNIEFQLRLPGGAIRAICGRATVHLGPDGFPAKVVGVAWDITEQKQAEAALRQARDAVQAAGRAKDEFLANMSHEIRTPMNAILGFTDLVMEGPLDAEQREYLEIVRRRGNDLMGVFSNILDLTRIEADRMECREDQFNFQEILDEALAPIQAEAQARRLTFACRVAPGIPAELVGDYRHLKQILMNLAANAVKFTATGRVDLDVTCDALPAGRVCLQVACRDTGIGIAHEHLKRIFEPFAQVDTSATRKYGGVGLGLTICHRLVERMGGRIWVESRPGVGSVFHVTLDFKAPAADPAGIAPPAPVLAPAQASGPLRILVVEDDPDSQDLIMALLKKDGHAATLAVTGSAALAAYHAGSWDLVLMDLQLPDLDGLDVTRKIRVADQAAGARRVPIVALTAHALVSDEVACAEAGMDGYLSKPVNRNALERVLSQCRAAGAA